VVAEEAVTFKHLCEMNCTNEFFWEHEKESEMSETRKVNLRTVRFMLFNDAVSNSLLQIIKR
jgi:hypothetical protein